MRTALRAAAKRTSRTESEIVREVMRTYLDGSGIEFVDGSLRVHAPDHLRDQLRRRPGVAVLLQAVDRRFQNGDARLGALALLPALTLRAEAFRLERCQCGYLGHYSLRCRNQVVRFALHRTNYRPSAARARILRWTSLDPP